MRLLRNYAMVGLIVVLVALASCGDDKGPVAPDRRNLRGKPARSVTTGNCELLEQICAKIDSAITVLENHPDADCNVLGETARNRFNSPTHGYREGNEVSYPNFDMYTSMAQGGSPYGWHSADPNVYVNWFHIAEQGKMNVHDLSKMVGHEEYHQGGWSPHGYLEFPPPPPCELIEWNNWG